MTPCGRSLGGVEGRGHLQSLTLLLLDAAETVLGSLASFGVGHAEHVVGLNSTVHTGVTRDGLAEHKALRLIFNAVESSNGLLTSLIIVIGALLLGGGALRGVIHLGVLASEEGVHGGGGNWLLQKT